jgi:gluconolactonase
MLNYTNCSNGEVKFIRKLVNYEAKIGPDGLTVDSNGNLYVAVRDEQNPYIGIYNSDGEIIATISMPEVPSNVAFGKGKEKNCLYITAGGSLYRIKLLSQGMN